MPASHRRGPWVPEEDQLLTQLVREQGPNNWVRISQHMHYRSPKQCRERFHQNLKPSLNREPISADEGLMIERMVNEMGKRWAEIARRLGNRSDNAVKNWWNGSMNRKKRGLSTPTTSRTYTGRIEAPYTRASAMSPSRSRFSSTSSSRPSWTESIESAISEQYSHSRRESLASSARQLSPIYTLPSINRPIETPPHLARFLRGFTLYLLRAAFYGLRPQFRLLFFTPHFPLSATPAFACRPALAVRDPKAQCPRSRGFTQLSGSFSRVSVRDRIHTALDGSPAYSGFMAPAYGLAQVLDLQT
ncbi:hypothetical protein N7471_011944 [Penicillium samsonianum]|uniref:uncharacterized protein n=1 Tax=Penicillium samsonianum TaxID=1882272 RepID=UPI0025467255|nr:uncharacterized protein N7471_011944 [Penicillium samsonianum]KAJ6124627.1 hypothetical protein N7471_011944 [Penicillium samsonianum]